MREYLIRRVDGEWFDLNVRQWPDVMRPNSMASKPVAGWGNHRIEVMGVEISFSDEDPGILMCIEGNLPDSMADQIIKEVLANIEKATGQRGRIVEIS